MVLHESTKKLIIIVIFLSLIFSLSSRAYCAVQIVAGTMTGKVFDENGNPLPSAQVTVINQSPPHYRSSQVTNKNGSYTFFNLPVAKYKIHVMMRGYTPVIVPDVEIRLNEPREVEAPHVTLGRTIL